MRAAALIMLALNLVLFAWLRGLFGQFPGEGHEPGRLDRQQAAEQFHVLTDRDLQQLKRRAAAAAPAALPPEAASCLEIADFAGDGALARLRQRLADLKLADRASEQTQEQAAWFVVSVPGIRSRAEADKRAEELRGAGERDALVEPAGPPSRFAVVLGAFRDREQARRLLARLEKKGVKGVQAGDAPVTLQSTRVRLRGLDAQAAAQVNALQPEFANQKVQSCTAEAAP